MKLMDLSLFLLKDFVLQKNSSGLQKEKQMERYTHPELLLPLRCHETLLRLFGLGGFLHTLAHLSALAVDLGLFGLLRLDIVNYMVIVCLGTSRTYIAFSVNVM